MLGLAYLILAGIIYFFVFATIFFLTEKFISSRSRRMSFGMIAGLIVCVGICWSNIF